MALVLADRVQQTGTANTTVSFTLSGSVTGFQSFAVIGNNNTTYYSATDGAGNWEVGIGTYSTTGPTLTRTTILSSSNSGSAVTFSGTVTVFVTYPSERSVYSNGTNIVPDNAATLLATSGGTGQSSYAVGDLLYASTSTALSKLADVATGNALISGGVDVAPSYGKIGLTTHVSGTLPVANGGTGLTSGTSGGVLYYSATGTLASSAVLDASALVVGGGAGVSPATTTTGTGVVTALGVNTGTSGAFVVNGGALGTPSSGTVTNLTGTASININGTVGATTANTGAFTTLSATGVTTVQAGTAAAPAITTSGDTNTGIFFPAADTIAFSEGGAEVMRLDSSANLQFNSGYGSVATAYGCRAWVNFNGTAAGAFAGGTSTVTRVAGSTTATVTTTNAHGLITGNQVQALTGVVAGTYTVTFISATQFSFTTAATTALTNASITFAFNSITASGNVSSIADLTAGNYTVNFAVAMPDANYAVAGATEMNTTSDTASVGVLSRLAGSCKICCEDLDGGFTDYPAVMLIVLR